MPIASRSRAQTFLRASAAHADLVIWLIGGAMLAAYLCAVIAFPKSGGQVVTGDAKHYFVQLRSIVFDRDVDFRNEYTANYGITTASPDPWWLFGDLTPTGRVRTYAPLGPALLWMPLYVVGALGLELLSLAGITAPPTGFERSLQMTAGITGVFAATLATWIAWRCARRVTDPTTAAVAAVAGLLGTHAVYYALISPGYSHAPSMLTGAVLVAAWLRPDPRPSLGRAAALGALAGCCALMRWQDALFFMIPAGEVLAWRVSSMRRVAGLAVAGIGALVAFSPQMAEWWVLYGSPFAVPQGASFMRWGSPHLVDVLFSVNHGLFTWTPLIAVCVFGLIRWSASRPSRALIALAVVLVSWYVNAAAADWWAGEAYGARRFLSLFPLFVVGLAIFLKSGSTSTVSMAKHSLVAAMVVMNGLLLFQYALFMKGFSTIAPYPNGWFDMWLSRFLVPVRFVSRWFA